MCVSVRSFLPPRASRPRNIGSYVFTATRKTLYIVIIIVIFAENGSFGSYGIICLKLLFAILTKNALFRQRLLRAHILNINMRTFITSAHGHEKDA